MKLRSSILSRLWLALWLLFAALPGVAQPDFYLHKNDRVVFYGDSITQQYQYASFVETYVTSRYPDLNVRFINAGWSGDWVVGGGGGTADERLARDVIGNQATVATFMVGMNDAAYQKFDPAFFDVYTKGYQHLLDVLQQASPNLRITLCFSPLPSMTTAVPQSLRAATMPWSPATGSWLLNWPNSAMRWRWTSTPLWFRPCKRLTLSILGSPKPSFRTEFTLRRPEAW